MDSFSTKVALCRGALASGARVSLRIRGTSMLPALWSGDSVSVRPANLTDIQLGELVVFVRNRHFVVHRFVRHASGADGVGIVTRGDACLHDDLPVSWHEFLGVVDCVSHVGRDRSWPLAASPYRSVARLIGGHGLTHGLVRRAFAFLARGTVATHALRNAR
jgi:hypothetical protein